MHELIISVSLSLLFVLVFFVTAKIWLSGKTGEQKDKALKQMQDRMEKAMEGSDDPNEPARWVP